jgi:hypothetical protein
VQRDLGHDFVVDVRYVGTRGLKLPVQIRRNAGTPPPANLFLPTFFRTGDIPGTVPLTAPSLADFQAAAGRRRLADFGFGANITAFDPIGNSIYHGASVQVQRRFSRGLYMNSAYTWSRVIDDSTNELFTSIVNPRRPQDHFNVRNERGLSALHREHKFTTAVVYEFPRYNGGNAFTKGLINGWQINVNYLAESGQPVTPLSFIDANGDRDAAGDRTIINPLATNARGGTDVSFVCRGTGGATSIAPSAAACGGAGNVVGYVANDPSARFVVAEVGARTNSGRNTVTAAGLNNWNLGFFKNTYLTETAYIQFRVEMINAFNHHQPALGNGSVFIFNNNARENGFSLVDPRDPNFLRPEEIYGGYSGTGFNRFIQFGLKVFF